MTYAVGFTPRAERQYGQLAKRLQSPQFERLAGVIASLADEPRPPGCRKLEGHSSRYRVRSGDYRIVYEVRDAELLVLVFFIGHRRDIYQLLQRLP